MSDDRIVPVQAHLKSSGLTIGNLALHGESASFCYPLL